ncbi:PREDICTED: serglycin [Condylura cristata]|uniref:serglycin n=1 Tax=Condylura cristata TaxID=143302 RepID=UPI0003344EBF|nr:PREDICTED: serglycin [Condylura cristata]
MQVFLHCRRLVLALALILVLDSSIQGFPMRRARYEWVRCSPDSNSANCIDEKGPSFELLPGESNRILPLRTDPFTLLRSQNLNDAFPLSEDVSGSGSGSGSSSESVSFTDIEQEYQPIDGNQASYQDFSSLEKNLPSGDPGLDQNEAGQDFII